MAEIIQQIARDNHVTEEEVRRDMKEGICDNELCYRCGNIERRVYHENDSRKGNTDDITGAGKKGRIPLARWL